MPQLIVLKFRYNSNSKCLNIECIVGDLYFHISVISYRLLEHHLLMLLFMNSSLTVLYIFELLDQTSPMQSILSVGSCLIHDHLTMLPFFVSFAVSMALYFMVCITQPILLLSCVLTLMQIGQVILLILILLLGVVSFLAILSSLGVVRSNLLLPDVALRPNIVLLLIRSTTQERLWSRWLLVDMGINHSIATALCCDSKSAIQIVCTDVSHDRSKHIEIDCHFIRQHDVCGTIRLVSIASSNETADIST